MFGYDHGADKPSLDVLQRIYLEHGQSSLIHHDQIRIRINKLYTFRLRINDSLQHVFALFKRILRPFALGDVMDGSYSIFFSSDTLLRYHAPLRCVDYRLCTLNRDQ